jgi:hypothetical protein
MLSDMLSKVHLNWVFVKFLSILFCLLSGEKSGQLEGAAL